MTNDDRVCGIGQIGKNLFARSLFLFRGRRYLVGDYMIKTSTEINAQYYISLYNLKEKSLLFF